MPQTTRARLTLLLMSSAVVVFARGAAAQSPSERAVRAVVDSFFAAVGREKWDSATAFIDLGRFEPYFKQVVSRARVALPQREITVDEYMATDSTMPRAVAEWHVAQMNKYRGKEMFGDLSQEFAGVRTQQALFALKMPEAAARWIEAQDERTQMREAWRRTGCPANAVPPFEATKRTVLATAVADDSTAYVILTDDRFRDAESVSMESGARVMRLVRIRGAWRILPQGDLLRPRSMGFSFDCGRIRREN